MEAINKDRLTVLAVHPVNNTKCSIIDPAMEFIGRDANWPIVPAEKDYLSSLDATQYYIGVNPEKYNTTSTPSCYVDIVVADIKGKWLVNQWTSEGVRRPRGRGPERLMQIGYHFARIGLPAYAFGPLFTIIGQKYDGVMSQVTSTKVSLGWSLDRHTNASSTVSTHPHANGWFEGNLPVAVCSTGYAQHVI
ncbi:hypothetical protein KVR01_005619 [Diaporthe batatas]|uniref:uncharacterized protein n=1 Tax=Diaporthe batatas TaxID=748121 RepID=UPI001D04BBC7|nr:uncharacterized protein KVR01_005619 [Diaporthe batatas]KAG8165344.1 hypothetical protein KVR01_005619 [Diaporthe batatas]